MTWILWIRINKPMFTDQMASFAKKQLPEKYEATCVRIAEDGWVAFRLSGERHEIEANCRSLRSQLEHVYGEVDMRLEKG